MTIESGKTLAGIGSLLMGLSFASIIGFILLFLGAKDIAEHYKDQSIYQNILKGGIFSVIGTVCTSIGVYGVIFGVIALFASGLVGIVTLIVGAVLLIVGFVFQLMAAKILKTTFYNLADRSGVNYFRTAGNLLWIGAILTIILIGFFLVAISFIILAVAFFTMRSDTTQPTYSQSTSYSQPTPNAQPSGRSNFCPNCGASVSDGATFCANCGKQL